LEEKNRETSRKLAAAEGRDMTREEEMGLGSASVSATQDRLSEMKFDFNFG
jgi:hypothetical protein